jgi:hypothetical protein
MSIKYDPAKMLSKIAPARKIKKLLSAKVTLKKTALSFVSDIDFLDKKRVEEVALKTIKSYRQRIAKAVVDADYDKAAGAELKGELLDDPAQLIQRVQNEVVFQVHEKIKENYGGQRARWLPSSADEPRPEHQLNYGKEYVIGEGIDGVEPGDEYGCQCGVEILTDDNQLQLD